MNVRRFVQQDSDDSGLALMIVIGAVALLVVLLTAAFYMSSQTLFQAQMADQHDSAFQAASSGVLVAFTELQSRPNNLPAQETWTGEMPGTSAEYSVTVALNTAQTSFDCTSTGRARDGTEEVVVASFSVSPGRSSKLPWGNNVFYFAGYDGGNIVGNGTINGPFYVIFPPASTTPTFTLNSAASQVSGGPLSIENADLSIKTAPSSPIDVYTNGRITGNAADSTNLVQRGWDASRALPVTRVDVGSFLNESRANAVAESSDNKMGNTAIANYEAVSVGASGTYSSLALSPPNGRPEGWTRVKATGASDDYKVLNSGLTITATTPSFGSWSGDGHYPTNSDLHDDFAYDASSHVLYIEGTVYVTGDVTISHPITYVGNGTIICTGAIRINASVMPATASGTDGLPDPNPRHLLGLFTPGDLTLGVNNIRLVAAAYMVGRLEVPANNTTLKGSFVAEQGLGTLSNGTVITAFPALGDFVSAGLPYWGSGASTGTGGGVVMTAWRRL